MAGQSVFRPLAPGVPVRAAAGFLFRWDWPRPVALFQGVSAWSRGTALGLMLGIAVLGLILPSATPAVAAGQNSAGVAASGKGATTQSAPRGSARREGKGPAVQPASRKTSAASARNSRKPVATAASRAVAQRSATQRSAAQRSAAQRSAARRKVAEAAFPVPSVSSVPSVPSVSSASSAPASVSGGAGGAADDAARSGRALAGHPRLSPPVPAQERGRDTALSATPALVAPPGSGRRATVIGGYAAGCFTGGVALPPEGPGYQVLRVSRQRYFGHPSLIAVLSDLGRRVEKARIGVALIGDMALVNGGPMPYGHASHQNGLDADIWLRLDLPRLPVGQREDPHEIIMVDYAAQQVDADVWGAGQRTLIRLAAEDPRVARIFVNPVIKTALCQHAARHPDEASGWLGKVRPWHGHDGHMHIRLLCPDDSPACEPQRPLPPGDGCDEELASWLPVNRLVSKPIPPMETQIHQIRLRRGNLPAACRALLQNARF